MRESHLGTHFAHWLPKGPLRRRGLSAALRAGLAVPYFTDRPLADRLEIYATYSEEETFYRSTRELVHTVAGAGLTAGLATPSRERVQQALAGRLPEVLVPAAGLLYRTAMSVHLTTTRR